MEALQYLARRLFILFSALFMLIVALFIGLFTYQPGQDTRPVPPGVSAPVSWAPSDILEVWDSVDPIVQKGYRLVSESPKYMGPGADYERSCSRPVCFGQ